MATIIDKLNFFRYSKDDFLFFLSKISIKCDDKLNELIKIINTNIKLSTGNNSPFNKSNHNKHSYNKKKSNKINIKLGNSKGWRMKKTKFIPQNLTKLEKKQNEINALLNKLSPKNYDSIESKILLFFSEKDEEINIESLINYIIDSIFLKAVMQPIYCPHYVKLLKKMTELFENTIELIKKRCVEFKTIIKASSDTTITEIQPDELSDTSTNIVEKSEAEKKTEKEKYDLFCKANKEKRFKEGYSQFVGELYNKQMITIETLEDNISHFVHTLELESHIDCKHTNVEDLLICISKLITTVVNRQNKILVTNFFKRIEVIKENPELQKRLRFKIMDLGDYLKKH